MSSTTLTTEQEEALRNTDFAVRFQRRQSVYIAYAGAGKTYIQIRTAEMLTGDVLIVAFNSAIIRDLTPRIRHLGKRVQAVTSHQLALRSLPADYQKAVKANLNQHNGQLVMPDIVSTLEINDLDNGRNKLTAIQVASLAKHTVTRFCHSGDPAMGTQHIPHHNRYTPDLSTAILNEAHRLWGAIERMELPMTHDVYFKLWALGNPQFEEPYRLIDEGQDTNPALSAVMFQQQGGLNVWAGDPYQSIYSWRGAKNALAMAADREESVTSRLTQSFRFGDETAGMATRLLREVGESHPVRGTGSTKVQKAPCSIGPQDVADKVSYQFAWIAFTNGALITAAIACLDANIPFHIVGQGREQLRLIYSAMALKRGEINPAGPFGAYQFWSDLEEEAAQNPNGDAARIVRLQQYPGFYNASQALGKGTHTEAEAHCVLSTVHAAKGREWDLVVLDKDLDASRDEGDRRFLVTASGSLHFDDPEDIHLRYVAVTRARKRLVMACPILYEWLTR